ncbi:hypothetical protein DITRI_Ditri10aG0165500 [Diplodiscus trichospermus]
MFGLHVWLYGGLIGALPEIQWASFFIGSVCQKYGVIKVACWSRAKWPHLQEDVMDVVRIPLVNVPTVVSNLRPTLYWSRPEIGSLKFNIDGSTLGKPEPASIGGVLRD